MQLNRLKALMILSECTGDHIWSSDVCRERGVPQVWIDELEDCLESGFDHDRNTIYLQERLVNQYQGIRDVDLAVRLGEFLNVNVSTLASSALSRAQLVRAIQNAVEED
jgi:hypothetical protein